MKKITVTGLRRVKACGRQVRVFKGIWPRGAKLTKENCLRALDTNLSLNWFAREVLSTAAHEAYSIAHQAAELRFMRRNEYIRRIYPSVEIQVRKIAESHARYNEDRALLFIRFLGNDANIKKELL